MFHFLKNRFSKVSLSKEYFIFFSIILSAIFILSVFYYCYTYSLYTSEKNEKLVHLADNIGSELKTSDQEIKNKHKLSERLKNLGETNGINYILVDNNCNILFKSSDRVTEQKSNICEKTAVHTIKGTSGFLSEPFIIQATQYSYFKKLTPLPFIIFTGFDKHVLEQELHHQVLPKLYDLSFMGAFYLVVLFFFRRKIITPISLLSDYAILISKGYTNITIPKQNSIELFNLAKALVLVKHYIKRNENFRKKLELANEIIQTSAEAREDFAKSMHQELTYPLKEILIYTEVLISEIEKKNIPSTEMQKAIKCIEKIREAAINIKTKTRGSLNLTHFDLKCIVKQAIQINLKNSFIKKLDIKTQFTENLPLMYGDELKLTKILVCLISQSIENSPENQEIKITLNTLLQDEFPYLQLTIKDYSFGLCEEELQRIQKNIGWQNENSWFENMEEAFVEKYVNMHHGCLMTENKIHEGRTVTLTFPLLSEKDFVLGKFNRPKEVNNVVYLHNTEAAELEGQS